MSTLPAKLGRIRGQPLLPCVRGESLTCTRCWQVMKEGPGTGSVESLRLSLRRSTSLHAELG